MPWHAAVILALLVRRRNNRLQPFHLVRAYGSRTNACRAAWLRKKAGAGNRYGKHSQVRSFAASFKLVEAAQKSWRRLDGHNQLPKLILGVKFTDGLEVVAKPTSR